MRPASPLGVVASATTLRGHLDVIARDRIAGWAAGPDPAVPAALQILDNGRPIAAVLANTYRWDLEAAGIGTGRHGFDIAIPGGLSPLERHVIQIRFEADGTDLPGSPRVIEPAGSFDTAMETAVAQAIAAVNDGAERERVLAFLATQTDILLQQSADSDSGRSARLAQRHLRRRWGPQAEGLGEPGLRALVIDERLPVAGRDAGSQAILSHIQALQALGYSVSLVAADELAADSAALTAAGIALWRAPFYAAVEEVLARQPDCFDLVYLHRASIAARYLNLARRHQPRARILYSVADLHHVRMERQAKLDDLPDMLAASRSMRLLECTAAWTADAVLTHSTAEMALLQRAVPEARVHCVPWSVAVRPRGPAFARRQGVAFIGHYRHTPNVDAARWLLEAVMPRVWQGDPAIPCLLVGSDLPDSLRRLANERVQVLGHIADLGTVLDQVRLTVAPLRYGAGVKGKVLESLAAGVPCIMTPVAAEGLSLPPELSALVGQDASALAALILDMYGNAQAHDRAAEAGLAFMQSGWSDAAVERALRAAAG